jgi:hypothetical protein
MLLTTTGGVELLLALTAGKSQPTGSAADRQALIPSGGSAAFSRPITLVMTSRLQKNGF